MKINYNSLIQKINEVSNNLSNLPHLEKMEKYYENINYWENVQIFRSCSSGWYVLYINIWM